MEVRFKVFIYSYQSHTYNALFFFFTDMDPFYSVTWQSQTVTYYRSTWSVSVWTWFSFCPCCVSSLTRKCFARVSYYNQSVEVDSILPNYAHAADAISVYEKLSVKLRDLHGFASFFNTRAVLTNGSARLLQHSVLSWPLYELLYAICVVPPPPLSPSRAAPGYRWQHVVKPRSFTQGLFVWTNG